MCPVCKVAHPDGRCPYPERAVSTNVGEVGVGEPAFICVDCGRRVHLDDANVTTRRGRCLCLRCGVERGNGSGGVVDRLGSGSGA
jgi:recombinational DNA repair protein (RecF pathway)